VIAGPRWHPSYDARVQRFTIDINPTTGAIRTSRCARRSSSRMPRARSLQRHRAVALQRAGAVPRSEASWSSQDGQLSPCRRVRPSCTIQADGTSVRAFTTPKSDPERQVTGVQTSRPDPTPNPRQARTPRVRGSHQPEARSLRHAPERDAGRGRGTASSTASSVRQWRRAKPWPVRLSDGSSSQGRGISALLALKDHEFSSSSATTGPWGWIRSYAAQQEVFRST